MEHADQRADACVEALLGLVSEHAGDSEARVLGGSRRTGVVLLAVGAHVGDSERADAGFAQVQEGVVAAAGIQSESNQASLEVAGVSTEAGAEDRGRARFVGRFHCRRDQVEVLAGQRSEAGAVIAVVAQTDDGSGAVVVGVCTRALLEVVVGILGAQGNQHGLAGSGGGDRTQLDVAAHEVGLGEGGSVDLVRGQVVDLDGGVGVDGGSRGSMRTGSEADQGDGGGKSLQTTEAVLRGGTSDAMHSVVPPEN